MKNKAAFIGFGKMAMAIVQGWRYENVPVDVFAYAPNQEKLRQNCARLDAHACPSMKEAVTSAQTVILACKPAQILSVIKEIHDLLDGRLVICVAAGMTYAVLHPVLEGISHVSIMPNTAMAVGAGTIILEKKNTMNEEQKAVFEELFSRLAMIEPVDEKNFQIAGTISGCSPAFLGLYAEALADAGVKYGLSREAAARISAQAVYGAGSMLSLEQIDPSTFKNNICSPGGTTIRGIVTLEKDGFRKAVIEAIEAIMES